MPRPIRERVSELVLRGIFTLRRWELLWYYQHGASLLFPDKWERFLAPIPADERDDLIAAYRRRLTDPDPGGAARGGPGLEPVGGRDHHAAAERGYSRQFGADAFARAFARIENHYFVHAGWLEEGQLLRDAAPAARHPRRHRPGPLRHRHACRHRLGPAPRLARGRVPAGRGCRPRLLRARHPRGAAGGHRPVRGSPA